MRYWMKQPVKLTIIRLGDVTAGYANGKDSKEFLLSPPHPDFDEFMAIENHSPYWCRPVFGRDLHDLPAKVQALLLRKGERYRYILPICADTWKTVIRGGQDGMEFRISADCAGVTDCVRQLAWVEAEGTDPLKLAHDCAEAAAALLGNGLKLRGERNYPEVLEYLGWCSWDAFQIRVSEAGLLEKAAEFRDKQVPVRFAIIDDMWADVPHLKKIPPEIGFSDMVREMHKSPIRSFEGDPVRFPALRLAGECLNAGGAACTVLNGANEMAVAAFLRDEIPFGAISRIVEGTLEACGAMPADTLEDIFHADLEARRVAKEIAEKLK